MTIETNLTLQEHTYNLGALVGNLLSLEFSLRIFLSKQPGAAPWHLEIGVPIYEPSVGDEVPENDFTSYDSLGTLISKFNQIATDGGSDLLDEGVVDLRDALVHGRIFKGSDDDCLYLMKFDRPTNGKVRVTWNQKLTPEWLVRQRRRVLDEIKKVEARMDS